VAIIVAEEQYPPHHFSSEGKTAAQNNRALRDVRVIWPLPILQTADIVSTIGAVALGRGTVTYTAPSVGGSWDDSAAAGSKFTDDTTDIGDAGTADILMMPATEAVGDKLILGFTAAQGVPAGLELIYSTAGIGGTVAWRYLSRNGVWTTFPNVVDPSVSTTEAAATFLVNWGIPQDFVPIVETEIDNVARYYVAMEVLTVFSTNPIGTSVKGACLLPGNLATGFFAPSRGLITHLSYAATAGAANNATILQVLNWTRGTRGLVTLTGNPASGRFALSTALYTEAGDELSIQPVQVDGTTEILNFHGLTLELQP